MKKKIQKIVASILATIMTLGIVSVVAFAQIPEEPEEPAVYKAGDIIEFGTYPQTDVTVTLGATLDSLGGTWRSYDYYSGSVTPDDGKMVSSNYMQYKDVVYEGVKYRGVNISAYRSDRTGGTSASNYQQSNGYVTGKVYWFRFDPIKWWILDESGLVICDSVIDSQAYNNFILVKGTDNHNNNAYWGDSEQTYYANNYEKSSIRQWLNVSFYETAFSEEQKENIETSTLINRCYASLKGRTGYGEYDAPDTNDKIFLISYDEAVQTDIQKMSATAYAKCQGVHEYDGYSYWWLRTPYSVSSDACIVNTSGAVRNNAVNYTNGGVCPAMKLNELREDSKGSEIEEPIHEHKYTEYETKAATCTEDGEKTYECTCGQKYTEVIPALGHNFGKWTLTKPAACTEDGEETRTCSRCNTKETRTIEKRGHTDGKWVITKQPTLQETGIKVLYCAVCGKEIKTEIIPKLHPTVKSVSVPERLNITYKHYGKIEPKIVADPGAEYVVTYSAYYANRSTVNVDGSGNVYGQRTGTALVTVTVTDDQGNVVTDTCKVTIRLNIWQMLIRIFLFGWIWY